MKILNSKIFLKILNKGTNSTKNNNKKNILTGKDNNLGKNKQKNIKNLSARKEVTVNLKWKRVNTYLKKKRRLWNEKQKKNNMDKILKSTTFEYLNKDAKRDKR